MNHLMPNEVVFTIFFLPTILIGLCFMLWYVPQKKKVKPRVAICWKCKYCVKQRRFNGLVIKFSCRTPKDKEDLNYITGKVYRPTFSCDLRNSRGTCPDYKKVWWRR